METVNNGEGTSLIGRNKSAWEARLKQTTNIVMQVSAGTKNKSCIYKTVNSKKKDPEEDFGKFLFFWKTSSPAKIS